VGLPDITEVAEYIHARHAPARLTRTKATKGDSAETRQQADKEKAQNLGQMIFNRPASSGVYAFVANLEVDMIGFNDVAQTYPVSAEERGERFRAALLALIQSVLHPRGALISTQLPHVVDMEGFLSVSYSSAAAPMLSPLSDGFIDRTERVAQGINQLHGQGAVEVLPFTGQEGLLGQAADLLKNVSAGRYRE
jgi:CRISPR-associated protein Cst2